MATIRLDKDIIKFIHKVKDNKKFGNGTVKSIISKSIAFFEKKHQQCIACQYHRDQVAGIELGRQRLAHSRKVRHEGEWAAIDKSDLDKVRQFAIGYGRSVRHVVEQAIVEHLTRPPNCTACPFFSEMCESIRKS
jgi:hypothetical protein